MKIYSETKLNDHMAVVITENTIKSTKGVPQDKFLMCVIDDRDIDINGGIIASIGTHPTLAGAKKFLNNYGIDEIPIVQTELIDHRCLPIFLNLDTCQFIPADNPA